MNITNKNIDINVKELKDIRWDYRANPSHAQLYYTTLSSKSEFENQLPRPRSLKNTRPMNLIAYYAKKHVTNLNAELLIPGECTG